MTVRRYDRATLLDCIRTGEDAVRYVFKSGLAAQDLVGKPGLLLEDVRSIGGGLSVLARVSGTGDAVPLPLAGCAETTVAAPAETAPFAGRATLFAVRNGESAETVVDWLRYHARSHGAEAALIVDRAAPGADTALAQALAKAEVPGIALAMLVTCDVPLGQADSAPEAHPINAPDAPGKDRMEVPAPDPWTAPLGETVIYEWMRHRFLARARAVANIDVHDLVLPIDGGTVFERAEAAAGGLVQLVGQRVYPWQIRKGAEARFGDHICRQFDATGGNGRWCVAPARAGPATVWRLVRVVGAAPAPEAVPFIRCMALRHGEDKVARLVPKTSLVEDARLVALAEERFGHKPRRVPAQTLKPEAAQERTAIVTTMKNEGPFILEWLAYHRAIGVDDFLIYTNDCTDGTDTLLDLLQQKGLVQHRDNPFRDTGLKPQHAALQAAEGEPMIQKAAWLVCMDVDEFINIHVGEGRLGDLHAAVPDANLISMTWRLYGNSDIHEFRDGFVTEAFTRCAPEMARKPHQAWGFKTLHRNIGLFKKMGVHRPKGLRPQLVDEVNWVNGSGRPLPETMYRNAWRSTVGSVGYDLVTLNHYAVRSAESFLVKRDRGRVNHVDRDQGLAYWFRMNNNAEEDASIHARLPLLRAEYDRLMADPEIAAAHHACVAAHRAKIDALKAAPNYAAFYQELTGPRMERLSRLHGHFGAGVFLAGPEVVPDEVWQHELAPDFFFTVDKGHAAH
ncbi:glycosyltransferase family 2 protein [Rhodovulum iodosum]|nr:glycosyltransferase family 2 protein [Rhodovulum robiginosum]RSK33035.1 glycosyltransferase family 2 protein [Rhodovulum robiginosum]